MIKNIFQRFSTLGNIVTETLMKDYSNFTERNFVDRVKLKLQAGHGGKGCVTYHRDRSVRTGAPDGGNGANGGSIIVEATKSKYDLNHLKKHLYFSTPGQQGLKGKRDGRTGGDLRIHVPVGTLVYEVFETEDSEQLSHHNQKKSQFKDLRKELVIDLDWDGKSILVAKGGKGGKGNGSNVGIREPILGEEGQFKQILLELKCLADIGLVGYPNAGKSTFLASVSRALPRIAEYPFTTLNPMIGKVNFINNQFFTIADLPGIIYDAHLDRGLGLDFLRHIERTKMLIFIVDISQEQSKENSQKLILSPFETIQVLRDEIRHYNSSILDKPQIVVANKCDLDADSSMKFQQLCDQLKGTDCYLISAKHGYNIGSVVSTCRTMVDEMRQKEYEEMNRLKLIEKEQQRKRELLEKELFK